MSQARQLLRALHRIPSISSCKASSSAVRQICHLRNDLKLLSSSSSIRLQRLASNGRCQAPGQPQFEVYASQVLKISSMASPEVTGKDGNPDPCADDMTATSGDEKVEPVMEEKISAEKVEPVVKEKISAGQEAAAQEGDTEATPEVKGESAGQGADQIRLEDLDKEDLLSLLAERESLLEEKERLLAEMKEKVLRSLAELENVRERLRREAESTKKYAIQEFAKNLLDVADNLGRAIATVPESILNEALANDESEIAKFLRSLLEGVMMTEKQLIQIFKKYGTEKFEPLGQPFDPNLHLALFEVEDPSKEPATVAVVVKVGYMLHDRVLRPAEVGVVKSRQDS